MMTHSNTVIISNFTSNLKAARGAESVDMKAPRCSRPPTDQAKHDALRGDKHRAKVNTCVSIQGAAFLCNQRFVKSYGEFFAPNSFGSKFRTNVNFSRCETENEREYTPLKSVCCCVLSVFVLGQLAISKAGLLAC